jgi:nitroreductase
MPAIAPDQAAAALRWRYATKQFDPQRSIPDDQWQVLLDSLVLAPSSFGLQPWKFIVVSDPALREMLKEISWGQAQVTEADRLVVLTARTDLDQADIERWIDFLAEHQDTPRDALNGLQKVLSGFVAGMDRESTHNWCVRQVYLALGQLMTTAAMLGVDACPLEGIDPAGYDRTLDLEGSGYATSVVCTLGYRDPADQYASKTKVRYPAEEIIDLR